MSTETDAKEQAVRDLKQAAANAAAEQIQDGAIVGLGSGSTASLAVDAIGKRVAQGLHITGIPTSEKTAEQAKRLGIPLSTLAEYRKVDVTVDGADEVELGTLNLIKGGGGNLLREKIVASASERLVIVVDETKLVKKLGSRGPVAVEVAPFGWQSTEDRIRKLGCNSKLRIDSNGSTFITDGGHYILDCEFGPIASSADLSTELDGVVGIMEHGLFLQLTSQVFVGGAKGVQVINP